MKKTIIKLIITVFACVSLVSCASAPSADSTDSTGHRAEKIVPGNFADGDISYEMEISDGKRSIVLSVTRQSGVTEAKITSPERLAGVSVVSDGSGVRLIPPNGEILGLTEESASGIRTFFDVMAHNPAESEKKEEGIYNFELGGHEVTLLLSSDGMPRLVTLSRNGYIRHGEVKSYGGR